VVVALVLSMDSFAIRFDVLSEARRSASKLGLIIVVTAKMSSQHDVIGSNDGKRSSHPDERKRNVLDATQALEAVTSRLVEALVNVRGVLTPNGSKGCSFNEFYEHPFPMFKGNLNSGEAREWLTCLEELLRVMDCTEEQRVKYVAYKFSGEARRWWYAKRNSLAMELGSEEAISWTRFKEEFYRKYSWSLRRSTPQELHSKKEKCRWCQGVTDCILGNADQWRICVTDVARWDTSFGTATRLKGMVLVHLEGNDDRTRVKRNH
jgi:hypothetical protein